MHLMEYSSKQAELTQHPKFFLEPIHICIVWMTRSVSKPQAAYMTNLTAFAKPEANIYDK